MESEPEEFPGLTFVLSSSGSQVEGLGVLVALPPAPLPSVLDDPGAS